MTLKEQIYATIEQLTPQQQEHVLAVARQLQISVTPPNTPGTVLLDIAGNFTFAVGELDTVMAAIRESEEINWDGWR